MSKQALAIVAITIAILSLGLMYAYQQLAAGNNTPSGVHDAEEDIAATVNGEPIHSAAVIDLRDIIKADSDPQMNDDEAYQKALDMLIREVVVRQKAQQLGLSVPAGTATTLLQQTKAALDHEPNMMSTVEAQRVRIGATSDEFDTAWLSIYESMFLGNALGDHVKTSAPTPSNAEVEAYLADLPKEKQLSLVTLVFTNTTVAQPVYDDLVTLRNSQTEEQSIGTFWNRALKSRNKPSSENIGEFYMYDVDAELPDYAQDAAGRDEGDMFLFERPDHTVVIYLVLGKPDRGSAADIWNRAFEELKARMEADYVKSYIDQLVGEAEILISN